MHTRLENARERVEPHIPEWMRWLWHTRLGKNSIVSTPAWLLMYILFYVEVSHLDVSSQHAKLTVTLAGVPFGCLIQVIVFSDRLGITRRAIPDFWSYARRLGSRWWTIHLISSGINQYGYIVALQLVGLPYLLAYPAASVALSLVGYKLNEALTFATPEQDKKHLSGKLMSRLVYSFNNLWLWWALGRSGQTEAV